MKKTVLLMSTILLIIGISQVLASERRTGTVTNDNATVTVGEAGLRTPFITWFKITTADTSITDSVTVTFQTAFTDGEWRTIYTWAEAIHDTSTKWKSFFSAESTLSKYPIGDFGRFSIAFTDTVTDPDSGVLYPTGDTILSLWADVPDSASDFMVVNDGATLDTTDYIRILGADSLEIFRFGNNPKQSAYIDSVVLRFNAEWVTDTAWLAWGVCVSDTDSCVYNQSRATGTVLTAGAAQGYRQLLTTVPIVGGAWTPNAITRAICVFHPIKVNTGGQIRIGRVFLDIYYKKGYFSPAMQWEAIYRF